MTRSTSVFCYLMVALSLLIFAFAPFAKSEALNLKLIPLPIYATSPNEGDTLGFMPVFLLVESKTQRTNSIIAPSISYNALIYTTATFRWFYYPSEDSTLTFVPSYSTNVNRNLKLEYNKLPLQPRRYTLETLFYPRRSLFERFFGLGPQSSRTDESSYTRTGADLVGRLGYNFTDNFNFGFKLVASRWLVEPLGIPNKPLTRERFANTPGMLGSTVLSEGISLRYEARPQREYSESGWFSELQGNYVHGLSGSQDFGRLIWETKAMWKEWKWLSGAGRVFWSYTPGSNIPFYEQSMLGGEYRFRGFNGGRFYDKGAWEIELEQRITFLKTQIYGVQAEWRVDPFLSVGQVYADLNDLVRYTRIAGGVGFRAWVRPNVVGRVDLGTGGDGLKIYVELGYPY